jgi:hypothetical protein
MGDRSEPPPHPDPLRPQGRRGRCYFRCRSSVVTARPHWGEGGDPRILVRGEAGEGLAAVTHKIDQFSLHTAARRSPHGGDRMKAVVQLLSEILQ